MVTLTVVELRYRNGAQRKASIARLHNAAFAAHTVRGGPRRDHRQRDRPCHQQQLRARSPGRGKIPSNHPIARTPSARCWPRCWPQRRSGSGGGGVAFFLFFAQVHVEAARGADLVVFPAGRTMRGSDHACGAVFAAAADAARAAAVTIAATCGRELVLLEGTTGTELLRQDGNGSGSVARLRTRAGAPYVLGVVLGSAGLWAPLVSRELMLQGAEVVVAATDDPGEDPLRALLITRGFVRTTALPIKPTTDDRYEREASSRCTLLLRLHSNYYTAFTRITDRHWARHVRTASLRTRDVPHCGIAGERRRGGTCKPRRRVCGCELV